MSELKSSAELAGKVKLVNRHRKPYTPAKKIYNDSGDWCGWKFESGFCCYFDPDTEIMIYAEGESEDE